MITVRPVTPADRDDWLRMRVDLWPDGSKAEHAGEIAAFFDGLTREPTAVLIAEGDAGSTIDHREKPEGVEDEPAGAGSDAGQVLGFVELSIRPCAEGCRTNRVAYLEGWYVVPEARRRGVGRALVEAAEAWGRAHGCTEFASDTQPDNTTSLAAHRALGFTDAGTVICFRKDL